MLNRQDEATGKIRSQRAHLWLRGLLQTVDVGRSLDVNESPTDVYQQAVLAYTDGGAANQRTI
eukprot:5351078-Heterocapsa_arctica.AAC.1